jgi:hypothetical protein
MDINRRKVLGIQYSRSEIAKVDETVTRNPWKFTLTVPAMLNYRDARGLIEEIDYLDRRYAETVSFSTSTGASSGLSYMFEYQGALTPGQLSGITVQSWTGTQLVLNNLPTVGSTTEMFVKGDFIQVATLPYPTTVVNTVLRGVGSTITLQTHRPNFMGSSVNGKSLVVGNAVQFRVFCNDTPSYKINPGGSTALVNWSGPFTLHEYTGEV